MEKKTGNQNPMEKLSLDSKKLFDPDWLHDIGQKRHIKYITNLDQIPQLSDEERERLKKVTDFFGFRANSYYLSLIDWSDPDDPIKRLIIPSPEEIEDRDSILDASHEAKITVAPSCEHKYTRTALILVSRVCGSMCRFCFRKRIFMGDNTEIQPDLEPAFDYISSHPEITNVLLTGGDSLMLSTRKLTAIIERLRTFPHIGIIRLASKLLAFNPYRILDDPSLLELIEQQSKPEGRIYIVTHFNHPREITDVSIEAISRLQKRGAILINQTPVLVGINDDPDTLAKLFSKLAQVGIPPYYVFQCRPTRGNAHFMTPIIRTFDIFEKAKSQISGLGKRARLTGSHASGKIEILGYDDEYIYFKYHQSKDPKFYGQFFKLPRKDNAAWWDDWMPDGESFTLETCPDVILGSGSV